MSEVTLKQIVEALLMVADEPLSIDKLYKILNSGNNPVEVGELRIIINELANDYFDSAIELQEVASGWRFQVKSSLCQWVQKLYEERPPKYSRAFLEILALIAYRQPITRAEIEEIRGVAVSSNIIKTLLEHEWVRVVGHKEVPGRPALFATTKKFLDHFNLQHLNELPPLLEFTDSILNVEGGQNNLLPNASCDVHGEAQVGEIENVVAEEEELEIELDVDVVEQDDQAKIAMSEISLAE